MRIFDAPGVYFERADANAGGVAALRTDVAGFVGIAERGPLAFFENGGRRLWAVRVASEAASVAGLTLLDGAATPVWRIEASSTGVWGSDLALRLRETRRAQ